MYPGEIAVCASSHGEIAVRASARGEVVVRDPRAAGAPGRAAGARAAGQQRRPHQRLRPSQARGRAAGEQQARGAPGRAAGARAAGQQRRPHQRLRPSQARGRAAGEGSTRAGSRSAGSGAAAPASSTVEVAGRGVGSAPTLPHAPPLWPCREEAPGGGLLRREAAGGAAAALTSPSRYQLSGGEGCGVNTDTPSRPSPVAVQVAVVGAEGGSTPLGWDGMGEYWDWVVWNKDEGGSTGAGRESGVHPLTHLLLSPFSLPSQQHPAWTTEESLALLIPPSLSTSQQPQHHGALHG
ncbi:unnamed protein product [Closterium sp. NIES-64]|nr:unnamed protein product [Closterium sp. NIES-64]